VEIDIDLLTKLDCLPRPKRLKIRKKKSEKPVPKWNIEESIFKKYSNEGVKLVEK